MQNVVLYPCLSTSIVMLMVGTWAMVLAQTSISEKMSDIRIQLRAIQEAIKEIREYWDHWNGEK